MSAREYQPGDMAMVRVNDEVRVGLRDTHGWATCNQKGDKSYAHWTTASEVAPIQRLIVIDPTDEQAVNRLADAFCLERWSHIPGNSDECDPLTRSSMQAALREFANPKPPKPEQPTGVGAVVEDENGGLWVQTLHEGNHGAWCKSGDGDTFRAWGEISVVRVLSDGVAS